MSPQALTDLSDISQEPLVDAGERAGEPGSHWEVAQETLQPQPSGAFWRKMPGLWMCSLCFSTSISHSNHSHFQNVQIESRCCAYRRQLNVSFVSSDISLVQSPPSFRFVMLKKCIYNLKSWYSVTIVILLNFFFF